MGHIEEISPMSKICCKITVSTNLDDTFIAYRLVETNKQTTTRISAAVYHHESNKLLRDSQTDASFNTDRQSINTFDKLDVSMEISSINTPPVLIADGYYYSRKVGSHVFVRDQGVNPKTEKNVENLGWLRINEDGSNFNFMRKSLYDGFHAEPVQCANSTVTPTFVGTTDQTPTSQTLDSKFANNIMSAERSAGRRVVVKPRQGSVQIRITQRNSTNFDVIFSDVVSKLGNFTATLVTDKNSNRYLLLQLNETSGLLSGTLSKGSETEHFQLFVGDEATELHQPVTSSCADHVTRLCLETVWNPPMKSCVNVTCVTQEFDAPDEFDPHVNYTIGEKESLVDLDTWLKYSNPLEWFNGVESSTEGFIIAVAVILGVIALSVLVCIVRCFCTCCKCCKSVCRPCTGCMKKKKKHKVYSGQRMDGYDM